MSSETLKIRSDDMTLEDIFKDFYSVPDFQREYVWEPSNVEKLLTDIYDEFYDEERRLTDGSEYFIGSIVACQDTDGGTYQLIDGQQRLTTIYLIFIALRDYLVFNDSVAPDGLKKLISDISTNPKTGDDVFRFRLDLQYEDSGDVLEILAKAESPAEKIEQKTNSIKHIIEAYKAILNDFLSVNFNSDVDKVKAFWAAFINRVKVIRILTPNLSNALKVFETINDRGIGLTAMDLLKNLLFMMATQDDYPKLKEKWKDLVDTLDRGDEKPLRFLRYFILANYKHDSSKPIREDEIYDWLAKNKHLTKLDKQPLKFMDELLESANAYEQFLYGKNVDGTVNRYLENMVLLSGAARQHFILLLAAYRFQNDHFAELCRNIENLFFSYIITREPTKNFERNFGIWAKELRACKDDKKLAAFLAKYFRPDMKKRESEFDFAFKELKTTSIQQYRMKYILAKLTQRIEMDAWGNPADEGLAKYFDKSVEIEHILPSNPKEYVRNGFDKKDEYDDYISRMGNLTLLEKTINASIQNDSFDKKRDGYKASAFLLTEALVQKPQVGKNTQLNRAVANLKSYTTWLSTDIESRQELLTELAKVVWDMP